MRRLTDAERDLASTHAPYAFAVAARFVRRLPRLRDIIVSAASEGVMCAAQRYDPARGKFTSFALPRIRGEILSAVRGWYKLRCLNPPSFSALGFDVPSQDEPVDFGAETSESFLEFVRPLSAVQRVVIKGVFLRELSVEDAGAVIGMKETASRNTFNAALDTLRERVLARYLKGTMTIEIAQELIRAGVPFGDVFPHVTESDRGLLRAWFVRAPGVPVETPERKAALARTNGKPITMPSIRASTPSPSVPEGGGDMCPRCGGLMVRTGTCQTCQSCGENSGGCG